MLCTVYTIFIIILLYKYIYLTISDQFLISTVSQWHNKENKAELAEEKKKGFGHGKGSTDPVINFSRRTSDSLLSSEVSDTARQLKIQKQFQIWTADKKLN